MSIFNPVQSFVNSTGAWQQSMKNEANKKNTNQILADSRTFYQNGLNSTSPKARNSNMSASYLNNIAGAILTYAEANGKYNDYADLQPSEIVTKFLGKNQGRGYEKYINMYTGGQMGLDEVTRRIGINNAMSTQSVNPLDISAEDDGDFDPSLLPNYDYEGIEGPSRVEPENENKNEGPIGFFKNVIGGAGDAAGGLGEFVSGTTADIIGWTAKQLGADDEKVNSLVDSFKNYMESNRISNSVGADTDSLTYGATKGLTNLAEAIGLGAVGKGKLETALGGPLVTKNSPLGLRLAEGAIEGAADMGLFDMVSGEMPSAGDLIMGGGLGLLFPFAGTAIKSGKKLLKQQIEREAEKTIGRLAKLSEGKQQEFLKDFGTTYEQWMKERGLHTFEDVVNYFRTISDRKLNALSAIKGRYKSDALDKIVDDVVKYAEETGDKRLSRFKELAEKNAEGGLEMSEAEEFKQFFEAKRRFNYDETISTQQKDTRTNMDDALRDWQREIAEQNGFDILADLNSEKQAGWLLKEKLHDMTKIGRKGATFRDFAIALSTGNWGSALTYLFSRDLLRSPTLNKYYVKLLDHLGKKGADDLLVDFEKIQKIQDEKEFLKYLEENGLKDEKLPEIKGGKNDAGYTILDDGETFISTPEGQTVVKDKVTEIPTTKKSK